MKKLIYLIVTALLSVPIARAESPALTSLLDKYRAVGTVTIDAKQGELLWQRQFRGKSPFAERSCTSCHQRNLQQAGRHVRTKKPIKPMAPSVNPGRLSSAREMEKWLLRNCKWTLGRECSASEKANLLAYISQQ